MEDEAHRRRSRVKDQYDSNSYKYLIKKSAMEKYAKEKGIIMPSLGGQLLNPDQAKQDALNQFPTLSQSVKLADDGTLNVTCNFGSNMGKTYTVVNSNESNYEEKRERFSRFLSSIPGSIYRNNNG